MEIFDTIEQGTPEWHSLRCGVITASELKNVMRGNGEKSETRRKYLYRLVAERITGEAEETYSNWDMERGKKMEPEAINAYCFLNSAIDTKRVAFVRNAALIKDARGAPIAVGASPDLLVGDRGLAQIKTIKGSLLVDLLLKNETPTEHNAQCQGEMWVCQRDWCDLIMYWPKMKPLIKRIYRDDRYIRSELAPGVARFHAEIEETLAALKHFGRLP